MTNKHIVLLISLFFILLSNLYAQSALEVSADKENVDKKEKKAKNGFFSVKDMIANCAGLFVAIAIINY